MSVTRSRIASQLSQRLPNAQVFVNGHEMHVRGVRLDFALDELAEDVVAHEQASPGFSRRLLEGDWDFGPVAVGAVFPLVAQQAADIQLARVRADAVESVITADMIEIMRPHSNASEALEHFLDGICAATSRDEKPPADPRARALWLRQNRNTGPTPRRRRPPKNIAR